MPDRKGIIFTLWLLSLLAPLAPTLVAPAQASESSGLNSHPDSFRRDFDRFPDQHTVSIRASEDSDDILQVNDFASENEEQDRADALDEPRISFPNPHSFRYFTDRRLIAPHSTLSLYHLRC